MLGIKPYISFKGNCKEAMDFYKDRLGAEVLFTQTYGESPMAGKGPDDKIMHCSLKIGDSVIMACDNVFEDSNPTTVGNNISLAIGTNDVAQADKAFDELSEGATILMPMQETFWAERFGMLTDKFGINWMFNCEKPMTDHAQATK
ncbi:MAG TPA: glyoxalase/bleomycin resistance/extradiol dioxygenase family protein [Pyrinomonadaceae bacterium]|nr:glyoxalase/bleomycin resistance/extradiol dioxygenase family protein [Pyrinomonadaceae bacterium]